MIIIHCTILLNSHTSHIFHTFELKSHHYRFWHPFDVLYMYYFLFCSFSKYIILFFRPLFCKMPSQQNTPLMYSLLCILVYNALPCIYIHRGYVLCCMLIQWFVNVITTLILPPCIPIDIYFLLMATWYLLLYIVSSMYHDYVTISLVNKLKKNLSTFFLFYVCSVLTWRFQVSNASVQMIGSLSTNEGKENKELYGMARWRQNEYLAYCLFLILRQMDFS